MLYEKAWILINNAASTAVQQLTSELVTSTMNPVLTASVSALQAAIAAEVTRVTTMTPAQLAASPSPDPNMSAMTATGQILGGHEQSAPWALLPRLTSRRTPMIKTLTRLQRPSSAAANDPGARREMMHSVLL